MPDLSQLTERQLEIYEFIKDKIENRGYGPTVREIGKEFNIQSPNGVMCHLKALEKKGLIKRQGFSARAIQLLGYQRGKADLPLMGVVAAGSPTQAVAQEDRLSFGDLFVSPEHFALRVRGQSMIDNHIEDGDYVVIRRREAAQNGERVVAMIDGDYTLKRFNRHKDKIELRPENEYMDPILVESGQDVQIVGVLAGVVRKC